MADAEDDQARIDDNEGFGDDVSLYWFAEFARYGLSSPQAHVLACQPQLDRHRVREALIAARAKQVDPDWVFGAFVA